ncbi:MAG: AbiV family abortive infection protein [Nitrosopumilus sp.]|nr:AbiV family abortive infection protein [Nitrosopumilus sp.]
MGNKKPFELTQEQTERAIKMCLDNAWSYLDDADMYVSNNRTEHLAIQIVFAMEEIGKAKIIYDKIEENISKIFLSSKDGIYDHQTKLKKAVSLIELDMDDELGDEMAEDLLLGGSGTFDFYLDPSKISDKIKQETELKNTGEQGHKIRLAISFVDFDAVTGEPEIGKSSPDLTKLIKALREIITMYPSSFNTC